MHAEESLGTMLGKSSRVIASHAHEQYREYGNLQSVILEVKVYIVTNESLEM